MLCVWDIYFIMINLVIKAEFIYDKLVILSLLNDHCLLRVYDKRLDFKLKLTCWILIGQNIVTINKISIFKQYW